MQWNMKYILVFIGLLFIVCVCVVLQSSKLREWNSMKCQDFVRHWVELANVSNVSSLSIPASRGFHKVDGLNDTYLFSAFYDQRNGHFDDRLVLRGPRNNFLLLTRSHANDEVGIPAMTFKSPVISRWSTNVTVPRKLQVRAIAVTRSNTNASLFCRLLYHTGHVISPAFIANINENHGNRMTSAYILCESCSLPMPRAVSITTQNHMDNPSYFLYVTRDNTDLHLTRDASSSSSGYSNFSSGDISSSGSERDNHSNNTDTLLTRDKLTGFLYSCLSPLHGQFKESGRLIEWFELNRILGVEYFTVYVENVTEEVRHVLEYYEKLGIAELLPWDIPVDNIHYHGQLAAINDCLYRNKERTKYLMITDVDEFIIPQRVTEYTLKDLIKVIGDKSAHMFRHTRFPRDQRLKPGRPYLITQNTVRRHRLINGKADRSKLIVSTKDAVTLGIHELWAARLGVETHVVDPGMALLHHYRGVHDPNIDDTIQHNVTWKYRPILEVAVQNVCSKLQILTQD